MLYRTLITLIAAVGISQAIAAHVDPNLVAKGARVYNENCSRCHNPRPAEQYRAEEWSAVIPHMRVKAHMTESETLAVEAFMASTLTEDKTHAIGQRKHENAPASAELGKKLVDRFGCQGCHVLGGTGGNLGPALDHVLERRSADFVRRKLHDPSFDNPSSAMPRFPLTNADVNSIIEYFKTL